MTVYLLIHDDREYEMGDTYVRGVYTREADAAAALVTRTPTGRPSKAYGAHTPLCCVVESFDVLDAPVVDVLLGPDANAANTGGYLIPESMVEMFQ